MASDGSRTGVLAPNEDYCRLIQCVVVTIPVGKVATYGSIAEHAGLPRRARLVGRVLRQLPTDSSVPWHRVVGAGGRIALTSGSAEYHEQCQRLIAEGVTVRNGRVNIERYDWRPSLDELLWRPRD